MDRGHSPKGKKKEKKQKSKANPDPTCPRYRMSDARRLSSLVFPLFSFSSSHPDLSLECT